MAAIYEFACQDGHEFQLWSDEARCCPQCGTEYLKRIFKTAPMVNTPKTKFLDNLVRNELENRGITNIQGGGHEGDREKITYKTTEAELKAKKVEADFPQIAAAMKNPSVVDVANQHAQMRWGQMTPAAAIKSGFPTSDVVKQMIPIGTTLNPRTGKLMATPNLSGPNQLALHDKQMVNRARRKDPENLQIKR